jgi:acetyl/propionyl-CoA carboxylase alpha subunit
LNLRIDVDGEIYFLGLDAEGDQTRYSIDSSQGNASIVETMPGVFSVLVGDRSFLVSVGPGGAASGADFEVWASGEQHHEISLADPRDRSSRRAKAAGKGPVEVRAQMPGKVIKVLVAPGASVEIGQGLLVIEAMKMQNEMKAPKSGRVARIHAKEGATVTAGEPLAVVE